MEMAKLSKKEKDVVDTLLKRIKFPRAKSGRKFVVGMIGLVGVGKSEVADQLAHSIGAVVVRGDDIRILLRKKNTGFGNVLLIESAIVYEILSRGGSVVVDSDFADSGKRNVLKKTAKDGGAQLHFVRVVCDYDIVFGRIMSQRFGSKSNDLFAGASSTWKGQKRPAAVKLREMWRRTPHHYSWSMDDGGEWIQKTIPEVYVTIDTTQSAQAKKKIKEVSRRILKHY